MSRAIVRFRITDASASIASQAAVSGELIELRDKRGEVHRGWVRGLEYELGVDQGYFVFFELQADFETADIITKVLTLNEGTKQ